MIVYASVIDSIQKERKNEIAGQMSLMDLLGEEDHSLFRFPIQMLGNMRKSRTCHGKGSAWDLRQWTSFRG